MDLSLIHISNPLVLNQAQGDYYEKTGVQLFLGLSAEGMGIGIGLRGAGFGTLTAFLGADAGNSPLVDLAAASAAHLAYSSRSSSCAAGAASAAPEAWSSAARCV